MTKKAQDSHPDTNDPNAQWRTARTVNSPTARLYSEWTLLVHDLEYTLSRARLWKEMATADPLSDPAAEVTVSLFRDAVISFVSCFDKQLFVYLNPAVALGTLDGGLEYFGWLRDMRNTWVAHRSGPHRLCVTAILIDEKSGNIQGLGHLSHLYLGPKPEAADDLIRVMETALNYSRQKQREHELLLRHDLDKLGKQEQLNLPRANTTIPGSTDIRMGRKKFANIKRASQRTRRV